MTKKEKLYFEYLRLNNELMSLRGEETVAVSEETVRDNQFKKNANGYSVSQLESMISNTQDSIAKTKQKNAIDAWFKTPDGIRYRALHTKREEALKEERTSLILNTREKISKMVKTALGDKWAVPHIALGGSGNIRVGVIKNVREDGYEECHFGCTFEIFFESVDCSLEKKEEFNMSFASKGSFDPVDDEVSKEYVIGMGKFVSNTFMLKELKALVLESSKKEFDLWRKIDNERSLLKTPEQFKMK
jgi:hypothetical protein